MYLFPSAAHKQKVNSLNKVRKKQTLEVLQEIFKDIIQYMNNTYNKELQERPHWKTSPEKFLA